MEEALTLNAADVGWGNNTSDETSRSEVSEDDSGWAKFDAFTDLNMVQQEG